MKTSVRVICLAAIVPRLMPEVECEYIGTGRENLFVSVRPTIIKMQNILNTYNKNKPSGNNVAAIPVKAVHENIF